MAEPTLFLFDGFNLLHAGGFRSPEELRDLLASWVAARGARGVLVFDGYGRDEQHGPLEVRWAEDADAAIERLAAEHRSREQVAVVSSDEALRETAGVQVRKLSSDTFLAELAPPSHVDSERSDLRDKLDRDTLDQLERLRRGEGTQVSEPYVVEREPVDVMLVRVPDELPAMQRAWAEFERAVGLPGRKFYGAFDPLTNLYSVCAVLHEGDDPAAVGAERATLDGGRYACIRLRGEPPALYAEIGPAAERLAQRPDADPARPTLEYYRRRDVVDVLVPLR